MNTNNEVLQAREHMETEEPRPRTFSTLPFEMQEMILERALPESYTVYDLYAISDVSKSFHDMMHRIIKSELEGRKRERHVWLVQAHNFGVSYDQWLDFNDALFVVTMTQKQREQHVHEGADRREQFYNSIKRRRNAHGNVKALKQWRDAPEYLPNRKRPVKGGKMSKVAKFCRAVRRLPTRAEAIHAAHETKFAVLFSVWGFLLFYLSYYLSVRLLMKAEDLFVGPDDPRTVNLTAKDCDLLSWISKKSQELEQDNMTPMRWWLKYSLCVMRLSWTVIERTLRMRSSTRGNGVASTSSALASRWSVGQVELRDRRAALLLWHLLATGSLPTVRVDQTY
jgi:hypothetical protein